jgi:hypothetical protein
MSALTICLFFSAMSVRRQSLIEQTGYGEHYGEGIFMDLTALLDEKSNCDISSLPSNGSHCICLKVAT